MSENEPIPPSWVANCNSKVDEVWVPSHFHLLSFIESGVDSEKIHVIPEATDIHLWDPITTRLAKAIPFSNLSIDAYHIILGQWKF